MERLVIKWFLKFREKYCSEAPMRQSLLDQNPYSIVRNKWTNDLRSIRFNGKATEARKMSSSGRLVTCVTSL